MTRKYRTRPSSVALAVAGTVAGLALGAFLAEKTGGLDGIIAKLTARNGRRPGRPNGWRESEEDSDYRDLPDDEYELAPESFSHMHLDDSDHEAAVNPEALNALEERVLEAFSNDPILVKRDIEIGAVDSRTIELAGKVRSERESRYAATVARGVPGVSSVIDRLTITGSDAEKGMIGADLPASPGD